MARQTTLAIRSKTLSCSSFALFVASACASDPAESGGDDDDDASDISIGSGVSSSSGTGVNSGGADDDETSGTGGDSEGESADSGSGDDDDDMTSTSGDGDDDDDDNIPVDIGGGSDPSGPQIVDFGTNTHLARPGDILRFTATVIDPDGPDNIQGGSLKTADGLLTYGGFANDGSGTYVLELTWDQINSTADFNFDGTGNRTFRAVFFDNDAHTDEATVDVGFACDDPYTGACDGECRDMVDLGVTVREQDRCECIDPEQSYGTNLEGGCLPVMSFSLTDTCDDGQNIEWRLFDLEQDYAVVTGTERVTAGPNVAQTTELICNEGDYYCWGATSSNDPTVVLGLGYEHASGCIDCCYACEKGGTASIQLGCPAFENEMGFAVRDSCDDGVRTRFSVYHAPEGGTTQRVDLAWLGADAPALSTEPGYFKCQLGERYCLGAWTPGGQLDDEWGVGQIGTLTPDEQMCATCGETLAVHDATLFCQSSHTFVRILAVDECNDSLDPQYALFHVAEDGTRTQVPFTSGEMTVDGPSYDHFTSAQLSIFALCTPGERYCFGAEAGSRSWGIGLDGEGSLSDDDCVTCIADTSANIDGEAYCF